MSARNMSMMGRVVPGMVLGFLVLLVLILLGDMNEVTSGLRVYDWRYFLLVLLLTLFIYIIRIFKWHFSLGRIGLKRLSFANSAQVFMAAFPLTVSQGKIAKVLKGIWLNKKSGLPVGRSGQVLAADQVSDWLALLALFILGVIAYPAYWPVFLFVLAAALVLLILIRAEVSLDFWEGLDKQLPALPDALQHLHQFIDGGLSLYRPFPGILAFVLGVISWLGEGLCLYLILLGAGLEPGFQLLATAVWITALASLIGAVSSLPGGLGAIEVALATGLSLFTGLTPALATVATVLFRLSTFWFKILMGLIVWRFSPGLSGLRTMNGTVVES